MKLIAAMAIIAGLAGCGGNPRSTEPGPLASAILRDGNQLSLADRNLSPDDEIRRAAYARLRGMGRDEARATLIADGFVCEGDACVSEYRDRIGWAELNLGVTLLDETGFQIWSLRIALGGDPILAESDLAITRETRFQPDR